MVGVRTLDIWAKLTAHKVKKMVIEAPSVLERAGDGWIYVVGMHQFKFLDIDHASLPRASMLAAADFIENQLVFTSSGGDVLRQLSDGFPEAFGIVKTIDGQQSLWIESLLINPEMADKKLEPLSLLIELGPPFAIKVRAFEKACARIMAAHLWIAEAQVDHVFGSSSAIDIDQSSRRYLKKAQKLNRAFPSLPLFFKSVGYDPVTGKFSE